MRKLCVLSNYTVLLFCILLLCSTTRASATSPTPTPPPTPFVSGKVSEVDKHGNAELDITIEDFETAGFSLGDIVTVFIYSPASEFAPGSTASYESDMPYFNGYYAERGEYMLCAYPGHTNISLCICYGQFAETVGVNVGDLVIIKMKEPGGAQALQEINNLVYSQDRADYASDEIYANFRPVTAGSIAEGTLYRSASPVNNKYGRAPIAYDVMKKAGIRAVLNLADTEDEIAGYFAAEDFVSEDYKTLYENGNVIALGLLADYTDEAYSQGLGTCPRADFPV